MRILAVILGFLMIGTGATCIHVPAATATLPGLFLGIVMIAEGIGNLISWIHTKREGNSDGLLFWAGVFSFLLGAFLLSDSLLQLQVSITLVTFIAIWMIVIGIIRIIDAFRIRRLKTDAEKPAGGDETSEVRTARLQLREIGRSWGALLFMGILMLVLGILCFMDPITALFTMSVMMGISIIISGIDLIATAFIAE